MCPTSGPRCRSPSVSKLQTAAQTAAVRRLLCHRCCDARPGTVIPVPVIVLSSTEGRASCCALLRCRWFCCCCCCRSCSSCSRLPRRPRRPRWTSHLSFTTQYTHSYFISHCWHCYKSMNQDCNVIPILIHFYSILFSIHAQQKHKRDAHTHIPIT